MIRRSLILFGLVFWIVGAGFSAFAANNKVIYTYNFVFRGDAKGKILLIIPFRVYYEAKGSVNFMAEKEPDGNSKFSYYNIVNTAYVARTLDFSGKKLCLMTADYDLVRSKAFGKEKIADLKTNLPYYSKYIRSAYAYPFEIGTRSPGAAAFFRSVEGIHKDVSGDFHIIQRFNYKNFDVNFNVDKIMFETLKGFNHSFFPTRNPGDITGYDKEWLSEPLDFTAIMNAIARHVSAYVGKHVKFKQQYPIRLKYKVAESTDSMIYIVGDSAPYVKIWGEIVIKKFSRRIKINPKDNTLLLDEIDLDLRNKKGNGGTIILSLKRQDW